MNSKSNAILLRHIYDSYFFFLSKFRVHKDDNPAIKLQQLIDPYSPAPPTAQTQLQLVPLPEQQVFQDISEWYSMPSPTDLSLDLRYVPYIHTYMLFKEIKMI